MMILRKTTIPCCPCEVLVENHCHIEQQQPIGRRDRKSNFVKFQQTVFSLPPNQCWSCKDGGDR